MRFMMKPSSSRFITIGAWPAATRKLRARSTVSGDGPRRRHHLGRRDEVGRVDRMDDEAAVPALQRLGEGRGQDRRGRAGEDRIRPAPARRARRRSARFTSRSSGVFSCTWAAPASASSRSSSSGDARASTASASGRRAGRSRRGRAARRRSRRRRLGAPSVWSHSRTSWPARAKADRPGPADEARSDDCDLRPSAPHSVSTLPSTPSDWPEMFWPASREQERHHRRDVVGADHAAQRDLLAGSAPPSPRRLRPSWAARSRDHALHARALDDAGQDGVDADVRRARAPWRGSG